MSDTRQIMLRYLTGDQDPALVKELDRILREDPEAGVLFAELAGLEQGLYTVAFERSQSIPAACEAEIGEDLASLPRPIPLPRPKSNASWAVGVLLAACLVLGVLLIVASRSSVQAPDEAPRVAVEAPPLREPGRVPDSLAPPVSAPPEPPAIAKTPEREPSSETNPSPVPAPVRPPEPAPSPLVQAPAAAPTPLTPEPRPAPAAAEAMAHLSVAHRNVQVFRAGRQVPVTRGMALENSDLLVVGSQSEGEGWAGTVRYPDGTEVSVALDTQVQFTLDEGAKHVTLRSGRVNCKVARQPEGRAMLLSTDHAKTMVLGTQFTLDADMDRTRLNVTEGRVRFEDRRSKRHLLVTAGFMAETGPRFPLAMRRGTPGPETGLVALYRFDEGEGRVVRDQSGVEPSLDLAIDDPRAVRWERGGGLTLNRSTLVASRDAAGKIVQACRDSNAVTIEAWIRTLELDAATSGIGEDRIVTLSDSSNRRNITLGQGAIGHAPSVYSLRLRTDSDPQALNGLKPLVTPEGPARRNEWRHVVFARGADGQASLWVNGQKLIQQNTPGTLKNWDPAYHLALGREWQLGEDSAAGRIDARNVDDQGRSWLGTYRWVAIYAGALTEPQVKEFFEAGPGD